MIALHNGGIVIKITKIEQFFVGKYLYVQVETDEGITGLGESGAWGYLEASSGAIDAFRGYLIGKDPLRIEYHWQYIVHSFCFRGAAINGAIGAIDVALWDIAGKYYNVPVYKLLGGGERCRDKLRTYCHIKSPSMEEHVRLIGKAKELGYTAVGHINPFLDPPRDAVGTSEAFSSRIGRAIDNVAEFRKAAGRELDLCLELHRRLDLSSAVSLARGIEQYLPMFYEDPIMPENIDSMGNLARQIPIPIATGERLLNIQEFAMLFSRDAVKYARISVCAVGGLTPAKKIASMAEGFGIKVVPHNPGNLSQVSTAACIQLSASIPNFSIMELPHDETQSPKKDILTTAYSLKNGYLSIPDTPGLGVSLNPEVRENPDFDHTIRSVKAIVMDDGSCTNR